MNERVLELAKLAGFSSCTPAVAEKLERFSVLMAQECSEIVRGVHRDEDSTMSYDDMAMVQSDIKALVGGW